MFVTRITTRPTSSTAPLFPMSMTANAGDAATTRASAVSAALPVWGPSATEVNSSCPKLSRAKVELSEMSLHAARGRLEPQHHPARAARLERDAEGVRAAAEEHHLRRTRL